MSESVAFEQAMLRLEQIVKALEKGDSSLEQSLRLFEEGTQLIQTCNDRLTKAELKIAQLVKGEDGAPVETEFEHEDEL